MYDSTFAVLTNILVEQESMKNFNELKILMRRQFIDEVFKIYLFYYVLLFYYENDESRENRFSTSEGGCFARSFGETETRWIL